MICIHVYLSAFLVRNMPPVRVFEEYRERTALPSQYVLADYLGRQAGAPLTKSATPNRDASPSLIGNVCGIKPSPCGSIKVSGKGETNENWDRGFGRLRGFQVLRGFEEKVCAAQAGPVERKCEFLFVGSDQRGRQVAPPLCVGTQNSVA